MSIHASSLRGSGRLLAAGGLLALSVSALAQTPRPQAPPPAGAPPAAAPGAPATPGASMDQRTRLSYALGVSIGSNIKEMKQLGVDVDPAVLAAAIQDILKGTTPKLNEAEVRQVLTAFQSEMQQKVAAQRQQQAAAGKKEGEDYLAANKGKEGVKTTASGLQYKVMKEGTGPVPKSTDTVTVHYKGTLINGTEFDSSYKRNEPASFPVTGVIAGWTEALQLMKVGSKYQLFIPSNLAYGEQGRPSIPPNSVLVFEVELLAIKDAAAPPTGNTTAPAPTPPTK